MFQVVVQVFQDVVQVFQDVEYKIRIRINNFSIGIN